jgi:hypothetical protein
MTGPSPGARGPATHDLKTWPEYFAAAESGEKPFEVRLADRDFVVGDVLCLLEWDPRAERYTGGMIHRRVTYILRGPAFGISDGFVVMGLAYIS